MAHRVNSQAALWRRKWLLDLIRDHETPWEFEIYASIRSKRTSKKVLQINNTNSVMPGIFHYGIDVQDGYGIYGGKFLHKNKELFDRYGIQVNYENLGVLPAPNTQPPTESPIAAQSSKKQQKNLREKLYTVKHGIKSIKKKIVKQIRKIKSLI